MSNWTTEEKDFLKRHYGSMPIEELAKKLDKSETAIYSKVYYLRKRGWTFGGDNAER
tara:strand:- start:596 stop:766 length:171 start_codon:yes stop_codon:yes gene_type:complete